jgi:hypothetical protein
VAKIGAQAIQETIAEVGQLAGKITKAGDEGRGQLKDVTYAEAIKALASNAAGDFDPGEWDKLDDQEQNVRANRLKHVRNTLRHILGQDGPTDPKHIMHWDYAGNGWIIGCALIGVLLVIGLLAGIILKWDEATDAGWAKTMGRASEIVRQATEAVGDALAKEADATKAVDDKKAKSATAEELTKAQEGLVAAQASTQAAQTRLTRAQEAANNAAKAAETYGHMSGPTEGTILTMVVLWGALGGSLHLLRSLAAFVGNRQLVRSWILHYFTLPFIGGALAAIVYLLLRVGLVSPSSTTGDGSAIANLNVVAIYGFAAMSGLFAKAASDKLAELFGTLFRTTAPQQKDPIAEK